MNISRSVAVVSLLACALVPTSAAIAYAEGHGKEGKAGHSHPGRSHPAHDRFNVSGYVVSVSGDQLTMSFKGGNAKELRRTTGVVTVAATATITLDGVVVTLDKLVAGDHVNVHGTRTADHTYRANKVHAQSPEPEPTESPAAASAATPEPTASESPAATSTQSPAAVVSDSPAPVVSSSPTV